MNPFEILNLPETANDEAVLAAYLKQVRNCPPDKNPEQFEKIRSAYETIQDERKRAQYALFHCDEVGKMDVLQTLLTTTTNKKIRFTSKQLENLALSSLEAHSYE